MGTIRVLLALSVVLAHIPSVSGYDLIGGRMAVQAFYIISGFYMSLILKEKYVGVNGSYKLFITNRFLRLYPIYWTVLVLIIAVSVVNFVRHGVFYTHFLDYYADLNISGLVFLIFANLFLFGQDIVMFLRSDPSTHQLIFTHDFGTADHPLYKFLFISQAWTISLEVMFYLAVPFLVKLSNRALLVMAISALLLRIYIYYYLGWHNDPWTYRFFPTELLFFISGMIAYRIYDRIKEIQINTKILSLVFYEVLLLIILFYKIPVSMEIKEIFFFVNFTLSLPFVFLLGKSWQLDSEIGELSYPIYICHGFVLSVFAGYINHSGFRLSILSIIFACLLNLLIGKRIEKLRQQRIVSRAGFQKINYEK